jgi:DNA-directed RNA polymerase specialized sigma24 family protein
VAGSPLSATERAGRIDWLALTKGSQATIREIILPLALGYSHREISEALGIPVHRLHARTLRLRREIRAQLGP